ncbi:hypothetical protein JCGZ_09625 [Jatropha curcas]|uniref:Protein kinase domain-containing protein n=1 Tax=Jatropha curcas TaxID=180498 RepID=A0A067LA90_JATCU|nr:hypothetical protein JCGZ_09625 [Jatropha curcas]
MISISFTVSQPPVAGCSLDLPSSLPDYNNSSCTEGDWGGFLSKNCCGSAFHSYLHAVGRRANRTGLIYLNSTEQSSCLAEMEKSEADVFSCGIDKLTSGLGGCSDFSVANVSHRLGKELKSLSENCKFDGSDKESGELCSSCINSWQYIKEKHPSGNDICRFAILISLTSTRIDDEIYIHRVFKCLENDKKQFISNDTAEPEGKMKPKISTVAAFRNMRLKESRCSKFPLKEICSATENLSEKNLIGEGTAGKVYKGILSNNQHVAIKHIINEANAETVVRELTSLSHVRHRNLVALLGYCVRDDECFLIYELCPYGNLSEWIYGKDKVLSWIQRLEIAIDSAQGLWFLHTYAEGCIVHRDVKPTNILLGPNFEAKLSDFGLSKVINQGETHVSSEVRGTFGYVDPEYRNNHHVNSSGDVYSFGIVLLQILSGKRVINMNLKNPMPLDKMAKSITRGGSIIEFADPKLNGEYSAEAFVLVFQLALSCTALKQQRPTMEQVVVKLQQALDVSTRAKASTPETSPDRLSLC